MPASSCRIARDAGDAAAAAARGRARSLSARRIPSCRARFASARAVAPPAMLGPMAVDTTAAGEPGLLLAGDAAGFIDPMTGDGLRFALMGAELAAGDRAGSLRGIAADRSRASRARRAAAARVSTRSGDSIARCDRWSHRRRASAARRWPRKCAPSIFERIIRYAGDCPAAGPGMTDSGMIACHVPVNRHCRASRRLAALLIMAGEAVLSSFNERQLRRAGRDRTARRCDRHDALGLSAAVHRDGHRRRRQRSRRRANVLMGGLALFGFAKALKMWAISSLGSRWSYRVLVRAGRAARHDGAVPLHLASELPGGGRRDRQRRAIVWAPITGVLATIGFGWLMIARMRIEDRALGRSAK